MSARNPEMNRWALALNDAAFGVWDLDPRLEVVHYSPRWKARLGFPRIDSPDDSSFWRCRVHPDDVQSMLRTLRSHLDGSTPTYEMRFRLRSNGWGYRTVLSRGRVVARDGLGNATRMIGTMTDLTGRPAREAPHGLVTEAQCHEPGLRRLPFHESLELERPPDRQIGASESMVSLDGALSDGTECQRLIGLVDDLLELALREGLSAR